MTQRKGDAALSDPHDPPALQKQNIAARAQDATDLSRRELLKLSITAGAGAAVATIGGGAMLAPKNSRASTPGIPIVSPWDPVWAFTDPMPIPKACQPVEQLKGPPPQNQPWSERYCESNGLPGYVRFNEGHGEDEEFYEARSEGHQRWDEFGNVDPVYENGVMVQPGTFNGKLYELDACEVDWDFYPSAAAGSIVPSKIWVFHDVNSDAAGILRINAHYGEPVLIRMHNCMPQDNRGIGVDQMSTHLHNAHNPPESDGGPMRFFDCGQFYDYWYPNVRAGFASTHKDGTTYVGPDKVARTCPGDFRETQSTLWFHDHRHDFTSQNVYKGLASFYTLFSDDINLDTGKGDSPKLSERGLGLPSGEWDIPILLTDKSFDPDNGGEMYFDTENFDGYLGDLMTVNFKIKPYLDVKRRRYRLRLLNAGPSRYVEIGFKTSTGKLVSFVRVGNDGNLLPKALTNTTVRLSPAERADIILDFAEHAQGTIIYMENLLLQTDPRGPDGVLLPSSQDPRQREATQILQIRVGGLPATKDISTTKAQLLKMPTLLELPALPTPAKKRAFAFETFGAQWSVNKQFFDPERISAYPVEGTAEEWTVTSSGSWGHPIHSHHEEYRITRRNGRAISARSDDYGRKDVVRIGNGSMGTVNGDSVSYVIQFRDWYGDYPVHCHNVVHEDHGMMLLFKIVPPTDPKAGQ